MRITNQALLLWWLQYGECDYSPASHYLVSPHSYELVTIALPQETEESATPFTYRKVEETCAHILKYKTYILPLFNL